MGIECTRSCQRYPCNGLVGTSGSRHSCLAHNRPCTRKNRLLFDHNYPDIYISVSVVNRLAGTVTLDTCIIMDTHCSIGTLAKCFCVVWCHSCRIRARTTCSVSTDFIFIFISIAWYASCCGSTSSCVVTLVTSTLTIIIIPCATCKNTTGALIAFCSAVHLPQHFFFDVKIFETRL